MSDGPELMSIQIRPGVFVRIASLPHDLTAAEAKKLGAVIRALVMEDGESPKAAGGHAAAASMTPEERTERATKAANVRWGKT